MVRLKEGETYVSFSAEAVTTGPRDGVFRRDTRYLSAYRWNHADAVTLLTACEENRLHQHLAVVGPDRAQAVSMVRLLTMRNDGFEDRWTIVNSSREAQEITLDLIAEGDFRDLFAALVRDPNVKPRSVERTAIAGGIRLSAQAADGVRLTTDLVLSEPSDSLTWTWKLGPGETKEISASVTLRADDDVAANPPLPSYADWQTPFRIALDHPGHQRALDKAVDDLRMLLFATPHGLYPAAGMPWFVNVFGRDALITSMMLLEWQPSLMLDVLRMLAAHQGRISDPFREEEPGKILHEMRSGELSRTDRIPFGRYYGSVDATALFVMALGAYVERTGDTSQIEALRPAWEGAINWLAQHQATDGGLIAFAPSGTGLTIQSWKDSSDSMNHADGRAAEAPLSVAEVQGYTFAAFRIAAGFYRRLDDSASADAFADRAQRLQYEFQARFWLDELDTYAMALDREGRPLAVLSSDPGHLLWTGIVPMDNAPRLVATLMSPKLWSGWGLRTLGSGEVRYNPVSYHNGSVWPHDTAIFGWGLSRYGFEKELRTVATALFDLAEAQPGHRLPELVSGHDRIAGLPPVAYTHACSPQAWAAASLPLLAGLMRKVEYL